MARASLRARSRCRCFRRPRNPTGLSATAFRHTVSGIEAEVRETGDSKVPAAIAEACRQGLESCEEMNPQGVCCLGNVHQVVKAAQARTSVFPVGERRALWATGGALTAAVLASACCWLPLLVLGTGLSVVGVAGFFEQYRPLLLAVTGLLLAGGFYLGLCTQARVWTRWLMRSATSSSAAVQPAHALGVDGAGSSVCILPELRGPSLGRR